MGEWSDYFEDFPEENPANWVNGSFNPTLRVRLNEESRKNAEAKNRANADLYAMLEKAKKETKARSLLVTENCPQCGLKQLKTYKINEHFYLCECQDCGTYGKGKTHGAAIERIKDAFGEELNWKNNILY